jgi:hypothetical protein
VAIVNLEGPGVCPSVRHSTPEAWALFVCVDRERLTGPGLFVCVASILHLNGPGLLVCVCFLIAPKKAEVVCLCSELPHCAEAAAAVCVASCPSTADRFMGALACSAYGYSISMKLPATNHGHKLRVKSKRARHNCRWTCHSLFHSFTAEYP